MDKYCFRKSCKKLKLVKVVYTKIIGSSGRDCVLIILFQLYGCKTGLFESPHPPLTPPTFILDRRTNPILIKFIKFLSNLSKIISNSKSKSCWYYLIDADIVTFFVISNGEKIQNIDQKKQKQKFVSSQRCNELEWIFLGKYDLDDIKSD